MSATTDTANTTGTDAGGMLEVLLDEREIIAVVNRYCRALDEKDWPALSTVFLPDATGRLGQPKLLTGIEAIVGRITKALEHLDDSQHLVGNHEIAIDGDSATHQCYLQAQHVRAMPTGSPNYIVAGRYEDQFERTADGWRIRHRTLVVMWTDGNIDVAHP